MLDWTLFALAVGALILLAIWAAKRKRNNSEGRIALHDTSRGSQGAPSYVQRLWRGEYLFADVSQPAQIMTEDSISSFERWDAHYEATEMGLDFVKHVGTHVGMYLQWSIENNLSLEWERQQPFFDQVRRRAFDLGELPDKFDWKFGPHDFTPVGRAFSMYYYDQYLKDFYHTFRDQYFSVYNVPPTWENYGRMAAAIDRRFAEWQAQQPS